MVYLSTLRLESTLQLGLQTFQVANIGFFENFPNRANDSSEIGCDLVVNRECSALGRLRRAVKVMPTPLVHVEGAHERDVHAEPAVRAFLDELENDDDDDDDDSDTDDDDSDSDDSDSDDGE